MKTYKHILFIINIILINMINITDAPHTHQEKIYHVKKENESENRQEEEKRRRRYIFNVQVH